MAGSNGSNGLVVTSAKAWRSPREEGEVIVLPSGNVARLRHVDILSLIRSGSIPDTLSHIIEQQIGVKSSKDAAEDPMQKARDSLAFFDLMCKLSFIDPKVVDTPLTDDSNWILTEDIVFDDKIEVTNRVTGGAQKTATFPAQQAASIQDGQDSAAVSLPTVRNRRNRK